MRSIHRFILTLLVGLKACECATELYEQLEQALRGKSVVSMARMGPVLDTTVTLAIDTDAYPEDFAFSLTSNDHIYASGAYGFLSGDENRDTTVLRTFQVTSNQEYLLKLGDAFEDGLGGEVALYYGVEPDPLLEIFRVTQLDESSVEVSFRIAEEPSSVQDQPETSVPRGEGGATNGSPSPTFSPTQCSPRDTS